MFSISVFFIVCLITFITYKTFGLLMYSSFMHSYRSPIVSIIRTQFTLIFYRFVMLSLYMFFKHKRLKWTVITKITFDMIWFVMNLSYVIISGSIGMCIFATAPLYIMVLFRDLSEKMEQARNWPITKITQFWPNQADIQAILPSFILIGCKLWIFYHWPIFGPVWAVVKIHLPNL